MQPAASYLRPVNLSPEQWIGDCCRNLGPSPLKLLASFFGLFQQLATRLSQMDFVRACSLSREQSVKNGAGRRQEQQQRAKRGAKTNKVRIENKVFSSSEPRPVINSRLIVLFFFYGEDGGNTLFCLFLFWPEAVLGPFEGPVASLSYRTDPFRPLEQSSLSTSSTEAAEDCRYHFFFATYFFFRFFFYCYFLFHSYSRFNFHICLTNSIIHSDVGQRQRPFASRKGV